VRGQKQHAFSALLAFQKILVPVENNHLFNIFPRVLRHARKLCRHPAQAAHHAADRLLALRLRPLRKRQF